MTYPRVIAALVVVGLSWASPLHAQLLVTDPINTMEVATTVDKVIQHLEYATKMIEWYDRAQVVLQNPSRYRTAPISAVRHDVGRFTYGGDFLSIYNNGDPRGERYMRNVRKVMDYAALMKHLPPDQRARLARKIAMLEIADSIGQRGGHVVGQVRQNDETVKTVLLEIEAAIMNPRTAMHYTNAILEKGNALALASAKQTETNNIVLSHILENRTFQTKRNSDAMTSVLNQQLNNLQHGPVRAAKITSGTTDAIRGFGRLF